MKTIYVFGNEHLQEDSFAKKVAMLLKEFNVIQPTSPEILLDCDDEEIIILDVVKNIRKPVVITDISKLKTRDLISLHDFDLAYFLKLMKKMGVKKNIRIIGLPQKGNVAKIAEKVKALYKQPME